MREVEASIPARGARKADSTSSSSGTGLGLDDDDDDEAAPADARTAVSEELVEMFDNENDASWQQYQAIKNRILRGKPDELRSHHKADLLNQLDDLQAEAASNGMYSLADRVAEASCSARVVVAASLVDFPPRATRWPVRRVTACTTPNRSACYAPGDGHMLALLAASVVLLPYLASLFAPHHKFSSVNSPLCWTKSCATFSWTSK